MKILVTGGAGFIGSAVVRELIAHSQHSVINVDCLEEIGYRQGWLSRERLQAEAESLMKTGDGQYLLGVLGDD